MRLFSLGAEPILHGIRRIKHCSILHVTSLLQIIASTVCDAVPRQRSLNSRDRFRRACCQATAAIVCWTLSLKIHSVPKRYTSPAIPKPHDLRRLYQVLTQATLGHQSIANRLLLAHDSCHSRGKSQGRGAFPATNQSGYHSKRDGGI